MKPRFAKELRPLLLPWIGALVIVFVISLAKFFLTFQYVEGAFFDFILMVVTCAFSSLLLAMAALPFGIEFQHRTYALLLSQPTARSRIWMDKMIAASIALGSVLVVLVVGQWAARTAATFIFEIQGGQATVWNWHWPQEMTLSCALLLLPTLGSVGFWTLVARATLGGMVFTALSQILAYGILSFAIERLGISDYQVGIRDLSDRTAIFTLASVIYGALFFGLSWRKFARLEASQISSDALSGSKSLSARGLRPTWLRCRPTSNFLNLIRKEFQLQRPLFMIAAILCALWVLAYVLLIVQPSRTNFAEIIFVLTIGAYIPLAAVLAGAVSLAEEKNLGIAAWHLTFPVSIWRQWASKLAVGFGVWVVLGLLLPFALTRLGMATSAARIFKDMELESWLGISLFMTGVFALSFWAMTLFSNTVRAVISSVVTVVALCSSAALAYWIIIKLVLSQPVLRTLLIYDSHWDNPLAWVVLGATTVFFALVQSYVQFRRLKTSRDTVIKYCCALLLFPFFGTTCYFLLLPFSHFSPIFYLLIFALLFTIFRRRLMVIAHRTTG